MNRVEFNREKYKILHLERRKKRMEEIWLGSSTHENDTAVLVEHYGHHNIVSKKTNAILRPIKRSTESRPQEVIVPLNRALGRPCPVKNHIGKVKQLQRR